MKKNVGKTDTYIRYTVGVVLVVLAIFWKWWLAFPAALAFATGYFGVCGIYKIFGINTCKVNTENK